MIIYHGSQNIIEKLFLDGGKRQNDYGYGFYCTENIELAKEWGCSENSDGYANSYELNTNGLNILKLNSEKFTILHRLTLLLKNRLFRINSDIARDGKEYLIQIFSINTDNVDVIIGYRADDSYFSFAEDFLNNIITLEKLSTAMRLGKEGEQVVLVSEKAFSNLKYLSSEIAPKEKYFILKTTRDQNARKEYFSQRNKKNDYRNQLFMMDIIRGEIKENDTRLR